MPRRCSIALLVLAVAALLPAPAFGKEITSVTITGPGLDHQITLARGDTVSGTWLVSLALETGFFSQLFDTAPDPTLDSRPDGPLGPEFRATYVFPNPETGEIARVVQDLYPYAKPGPVTYIPGGQEFWKGAKSHGGWYVARAYMKSALVKAGLPRNEPAVRTNSGSSMGTWAGGAAGAAALVLFLAYLAHRRRSTASE